MCVQGTCHISIMLAEQITPAIVPSALRQHVEIDIATEANVYEAAQRGLWCVTEWRTPGAWIIGQYKGLGVYVWPSKSDISKRYRDRRAADDASVIVSDPLATS